MKENTTYGKKCILQLWVFETGVSSRWESIPNL